MLPSHKLDWGLFSNHQRLILFVNTPITNQTGWCLQMPQATDETGWHAQTPLVWFWDGGLWKHPSLKSEWLFHLLCKCVMNTLSIWTPPQIRFCSVWNITSLCGYPNLKLDWWHSWMFPVSECPPTQVRWQGLLQMLPS